MLFNVALLSTLSLVPAVVAFQPNNHLIQDTVSYSTNWAGAIWTEGNGTFMHVTGTFTVPTPKGAIGDSAAIWIGIDGDTCRSAILQTGIALTVGKEDQPSYFAWYEWYPAPAYNLSGITIDAGDVIRLTVLANSTTSGTATIENLTKDKTVYKQLNSTAPLCGQSAEWIIEDYAEGTSMSNMTLVPFANFGTVTFTDASATGSDGTWVHAPSGANISDIRQNNTVLTSTSTDGSSVTISYV